MGDPSNCRDRFNSVDLLSVSTPIRNQYLRLKAQFPGAIHDVRPAGQVVRDVAAEAARLLAMAAGGAASA